MAIPSWLQLSAVSGSGDTQITITASTTEEFYERAYSLLISGHTKTLTIPVTQEPLENTLSVYPSSHVFEYTGGTFQYTVTSNSNWTITSHPNWLTFDVLSGTTGTSSVNVTSDTNYDAQKEADIVFSAVTTTASTHVTQEAYEPGPSLSEYLTFNITSPGTIVWKTDNASWSKTIYYRKNSGQWTSISATTAGTSFSVTTGDVIEFKGDNSAYGRSMGLSRNTFSGSTAEFSVSGNIMSLINSTSFSNLKTLTTGYTFMGLFSYTHITSSNDLLLPATTLSSHCYDNMFHHCEDMTSTPELAATTLASGCYGRMFWSCTSLTTAPELPATTLASSCYDEMFLGCTSLTTAPELPATTLRGYCYVSMFYGCTSLTSAPELPATTLAEECYREMFYGCTNLNYVKCLATDINASGCLSDWLKNVSSSGTFVKNPSMSSWTTGPSGIPSNWTTVDAT